MTAPTPHDHHLWSHIVHHSDPLTLLQHLQTGSPLIIVSDATLNGTKQSCFAWTFHTTTTLWKGEGAVPGPAEDATSTRSKAFGIYTALRFLAHYLSHFPTTLNKAQPVTIYCNNRSALQ